MVRSITTAASALRHCCMQNQSMARTIVVISNEQVQHRRHQHSVRTSRIYSIRSSCFLPKSLHKPPSKCFLSNQPTADVAGASTQTTVSANDQESVETSHTATSSVSTTTAAVKIDHSTASASSPTSSIPLVYESPLGNVVTKLRTVSLGTAFIGMTGVPCMIALKGGGIPESGILAAALLFVSGSIGSTAAIHFVFSPYVYKIEQIPIRVCSTPTTDTTTETKSDNTSSHSSVDGLETTNKIPTKDTLLKAWVRTLFLRNDSIVFDATIDVQPYQGLRPMCNFVAKGRPLYVHPGT